MRSYLVQTLILLSKISKTIEIRFVLLLLLLLRHELSHSDQDQTRSGLDRIRHDQAGVYILQISRDGISRKKLAEVKKSGTN